CRELTMAKLRCSVSHNETRLINRLRLVECLGNGTWAIVYAYKDYALKIGDINDNWLVWADFVMNSAPAPWLPVIHHVRRFPKQGLYLALMERLDGTAWQLYSKRGCPYYYRYITDLPIWETLRHIARESYC